MSEPFRMGIILFSTMLILPAGAITFKARVASATSGGNIEIHLDSTNGTLVGTCAVTGTGGWQTWVTQILFRQRRYRDTQLIPEIHRRQRLPVQCRVVEIQLHHPADCAGGAG